ncbi:hypothetical protein [Chryseobacterium indoltheticum]|jgi:hypothetical protein|uniref:hypothetical protein n=1 Tax=Chryseobacterium indoltheticum TaxID=254 RepID=UPI00242FB80C|nr:hypothetical protein [Chryseobacterium indoltheticum]MDF2833192.1 hypothetical protein [Chryseobacterium indoltheticum]
MKKQIFTIALLCSGLAYSQVGIDTETPKATLDVTGKPTDMSKIDGFIVPRLAGTELKAKDALYGADQNAALIYVTTPLAAADTSAKTINVTSSGYYFFDGNIWQKLNSGNTATDWSLVGNSGTTAGINFIGTIDTQDFIVKTNNTERERTYNTVDANNTIKTITGGDLNLNGITVGRGGGNKNSNAVVGYESLKVNDTGGNNVAMGSFALYNSTEGFSNVAIGHSAMTGNTEGNSNVAIGQSTLPYNTTGDLNVAIGHSALSNPLNKTGRHNIGIGFTAGGNLEDATSNNIAIGSFQDLATSTGSNQLNIGGVIFGTGLTGTQTAPAGNIGIGTTAPSTRLEVNNGTTNGAIKIVDGTQGEGKVLTSDASGLATWRASASFKTTALGVFPSSNITTLSDLNSGSTNQQKYTGVYIDLEPGKWVVNTGMTIYCFKGDLTHFQHAYLSTSQTAVTQTNFQNLGSSTNVAFAGKISNGPIEGIDGDPQRNANFISGASVISVSQPTRIYLLLENKPDLYWSYSTSAWENYLYAVPIN